LVTFGLTHGYISSLGCRGGSVNSIDSALYYKGCNIVEGKLEIEIRTGMDSTDAAKLVEAFGEIEEIDDYLLVRFSASFVSLHMFKQLRRINGRTLWRQRFVIL
jgi:insulin receptor